MFKFDITNVPLMSWIKHKKLSVSYTGHKRNTYGFHVSHSFFFSFFSAFFHPFVSVEQTSDEVLQHSRLKGVIYQVNLKLFLAHYNQYFFS